jgi:2-isopropylmalate synthase
LIFEERKVGSQQTGESMAQAAAAKRQDTVPADFVPLGLEDLTLISGTRVVAQATIKVARGGRRWVLASEGNGPIDALCNALQEVVPGFKVVKYQVVALEEGSDAPARGSASIKVGERTFSGEDTDKNTDVAGAKAILAALNDFLAYELRTAFH